MAVQRYFFPAVTDTEITYSEIDDMEDNGDMLCTRCKKRTAVVFITAMQGDEKRNEGLCLVCAKELGIPQVKEYMDQMGISDDEVEEFADQMTDITEALDGDSFQHGGTGAFPGFIQNLFGGTLKNFGEKMKSNSENSSGDFWGSDQHKESSVQPEKNHKKKRKTKFLDSYCTNLTQRASDGKLDNIIGREKEIARTIQILSRRQ